MSSAHKKRGVPATKTPSVVTLALQLPTGERIVHDFPPEAALWSALQHFDAEKCLNPSLQSLGNDVPACIYLRQEVSGQRNLEETTFTKLGITGGKVAMRYLLKPADSPREQAHVGGIILPTPRQPSPEIRCRPQAERAPEPVPMEVDEKPSLVPAVADQSEPSSAIPEQTKAPVDVRSGETSEAPRKREVLCEKEAPAPVQTKQEKIEPTTASIERATSPAVMKKKARLEVDERKIPLNERGDLLYSLDDASLSADVKAVDNDLADDFFELTVDDLRKLLHDLKRQYAVTESPLLTAEMRRSQEERRFHDILQRYPFTVLRIQFPDRLTLQIPFQSESTIANVKDALVEYLEGRVELGDFHLYTAPPKKIVDVDLTLLRGGLTPSAVLYIGSEKHTCRVREEYRSKLSSYFGAMRDASDRLSPGEQKPKTSSERQARISFGPAAVLAEETEERDEESRATGTEKVIKSTGPVPKWFKMKK